MNKKRFTVMNSILAELNRNNNHLAKFIAFHV